MIKVVFKKQVHSCFAGMSSNDIYLHRSKPRVKKTVWLHHHKDGRSIMFSNPIPVREGTIARTKHEIDVEHGHGLGDANE